MCFIKNNTREKSHMCETRLKFLNKSFQNSHLPSHIKIERTRAIMVTSKYTSF